MVANSDFCKLEIHSVNKSSLPHEDLLTECKRRYSTSFISKIVDQINKFQLSSKALINGKINIFLPPAVSSYTYDNLFYLGSFSIMEGAIKIDLSSILNPCYIILFSYEGSGIIHYQEKCYHLDAGCGIFLDGNDIDAIYSKDSHWKFSSLCIGGQLLDYIYNEYSATGNLQFFQSMVGAYHIDLEQLLKKCSSESHYKDLLISNKISDLLVNLLENHASDDYESHGTIQYLIKYIESNYHNHLSLDFLAKFTCMSKSTLIREFKKYTGFTPGDYITMLRIEKSKLLLMTTNHTISWIAAHVGFSDRNNFTRLFKGKTGLTPSKYRLEMTNN